MNKYEKLFEDISEKTNSGDLQWKQINKSSNADLIFNPDTSFRQYLTEYKKGDETYKVVFVEKKIDDPTYDYAFQRYIPELLVIGNGNELLVTLTDSVIDKDKMIELVGIIEDNNDKTKKLFE